MEVTETLKFQRLFFEKDDFRIALFKRQDGSYLKAKGKHMPCEKDILYSFTGIIEESEKYGPTLVVKSFDEVRPDNRNGIIKYLMTLKGIGKVSATKIYNAYGDNVYDVLDNDIDRVYEDKVIGKAAFEKMKASWLEKSAAKELFLYLYDYNVPQRAIVDIFDRFERNAVRILCTNPYQMVGIPGFSFRTADQIAKANNLDMYGTNRIRAGIIAVLNEYEQGGTLIKNFNRIRKANLQSGNMCIEWKHLYPLLCGLLEITISKKEVADIMKAMVGIDIMIYDKKYIFKMSSYLEEQTIAENICRLLKHGTAPSLGITPENVASMQKVASYKGELSGILSDEQCNAVCTALNNPISIITGGPGTGKTMIQKSIINTTLKLQPKATILLAAPTGRAARRMSESTGYPAQTVHSALGIYAGDSNLTVTGEIDADLVLIDEFSMVDSNVASLLFQSLHNKTRVVMVGDDKQLPSVGPGAVLREMIGSKVVPTATLTNVFRQAKGSSIGTNSRRMVKGETKMLLDESFVFVDRETTADIAKTVFELYQENLEEFGKDEIMVLSPYKRSTATGVNMLNDELQNLVHGKTVTGFEIDDKVMYTKNDNGLANGDIGFIRDIQKKDGELTITCDFGEGDVALEGEAVDNLELAYATTIHKSQGSEAKLVIMVSDKAHSLMLKRNLVYTGVTRAKAKIIIIGDRETFSNAILQEETSVRLSMLARFIKEQFLGISAPSKLKSGKNGDVQKNELYHKPITKDEEGEQLKLCV